MEQPFSSPNVTESTTDRTKRLWELSFDCISCTRLVEPCPFSTAAEAQVQGTALNSHLPKRRPGDPPLLFSPNGRDITNGYLYFVSSMQELGCRAGDPELRPYDYEQVPLFTRRAYERPAEWMDTRWRFGVAGGYYEEPRPQHWRRQGPALSQRTVRFRDGSSVIFGPVDSIPQVNSGDAFINQMMSIDASKEKLRRAPSLHRQPMWNEDGHQAQLLLDNGAAACSERSILSASSRRHTTANESPIEALQLDSMPHRKNISLHDVGQRTKQATSLATDTIMGWQERQQTWAQETQANPAHAHPLQSSWYNMDMTLEELNKKLGPICPIATWPEERLA